MCGLYSGHIIDMLWLKLIYLIFTLTFRYKLNEKENINYIFLFLFLERFNWFMKFKAAVYRTKTLSQGLLYKAIYTFCLLCPVLVTFRLNDLCKEVLTVLINWCLFKGQCKLLFLRASYNISSNNFNISSMAKTQTRHSPLIFCANAASFL